MVIFPREFDYCSHLEGMVRTTLMKRKKEKVVPGLVESWGGFKGFLRMSMIFKLI